MQANEFFQFHLSNVIELGALILAYLGFRSKSKKDDEEREKARAAQTVLHTENTNKLNLLMDFNRNQADINKQRDIQINMLATQTASLIEIAKGYDRRLTMLENDN